MSKVIKNKKTEKLFPSQQSAGRRNVFDQYCQKTKKKFTLKRSCLLKSSSKQSTNDLRVTKTRGTIYSSAKGERIFSCRNIASNEYKYGNQGVRSPLSDVLVRCEEVLSSYQLRYEELCEENQRLSRQNLRLSEKKKIKEELKKSKIHQNW